MTTTETKTDSAPANGTPPTQTTALARAESYLQQPRGSIAAFSSPENFDTAQRMAKALAASSLVPEAYKGNLANALIAMELASRIGASVFMVMQNLDVIHGNPSFRAKFLIATVNSSGRFTPLRYEWQDKPGSKNWGCRAVAKDRSTGDECLGPWVTWAMAEAEGWTKKNGSKWKTLPELMFMYRAAAFWTRVYCPELSLGMSTAEEVIDTYGEPVATTPLPQAIAPGSASDLEAALRGNPAPVVEADAEVVDPETGEVMREPGSEG